MALAALLTTYNKEIAIQLAQGDYEFPGSLAFSYIVSREGARIGIDYEVLRDEIMLGLPTLVDYRGEEKKAFIAVVPPFKVQLKGFGLLGFQINYYAFHSVIGLFRYLVQRHIDDEPCLGHLSQAAKYCGRLHIVKGVPMCDQVALANAILKEIGLMA